MSETQMACPSCGQHYCYGFAPGDRCCTACNGDHANDTYLKFYPEPTDNKENQ